MPSPQEIEAKMTARKGWTRAQLAEWGVPWPPPRGWRRQLETEWQARREKSAAAERFERRAQDDAAWADEHHAKVRFDGRGYRATCSCLASFARRETRAEADADVARHAR